LVYREENHKEHKIIIEYDGFKEHFKDDDGIDSSNYQDYYTDADIYREKVLESYGYRFLRVNKFNAGSNPISMLSERIENLIKSDTEKNNVISHIRETIGGLQNGEMKECPKCKDVRNTADFKDPALITGYGRFCKYCKGHSVSPAVEERTGTVAATACEEIRTKPDSKRELIADAVKQGGILSITSVLSNKKLEDK